MHLPGSSPVSSAFPTLMSGRLPASFRERDFSRGSFRGCSYFVMFRPPSWLASRIAPTAAGFPAGQLRRLRPSRTCVVASARIGYARRPTTGNWRHEDFHLARFTALSTAPSACLPSLDRGIRQARRPPEPHAWSLPWFRAFPHLPRPSRFQPRMRSLPRPTRQHFPNPRPRH